MTRLLNVGEDKKTLVQQMNETVARSRQRKLVPKEKRARGRPSKQQKPNPKLYEQDMFKSDSSTSDIEEVPPLPPPIFIPGQQQREELSLRLIKGNTRNVNVQYTFVFTERIFQAWPDDKSLDDTSFNAVINSACVGARQYIKNTSS